MSVGNGRNISLAVDDQTLDFQRFVFATQLRASLLLLRCSTLGHTVPALGRRGRPSLDPGCGAAGQSALDRHGEGFQRLAPPADAHSHCGQSVKSSQVTRLHTKHCQAVFQHVPAVARGPADTSLCRPSSAHLR